MYSLDFGNEVTVSLLVTPEETPTKPIGLSKMQRASYSAKVKGLTNP
jgi:hypothetical protein